MAEPCNSCGAEIVFEAGKQSLICPFCGTVNQVARPENSLETSFDRIVPITVTPHELDNRLYVYMTSGEFTPDDMIEASTITLRERYYVPAFAFKVDYEATWTASFGFDRQEPYTAYRNVTLNGHTRQEPYTAYKTVTDWRPANGVDSGIFNVAGYAGTQLNGSPLAPANLVVHAVINGSTTEYNPSFIKGFEVEGFSVPEKIAFESLNGEINTIIDKRVQNHAQGDKQRDWHWNARMSHDTSTYAVPICHGAFQYGDKEYHVWVGGHDVETIRADELPVDKDKQEAANIGFIPGALGLVTAIGSAYYWSFVWSSLIATGIALSYGFMRRKALIDYSKSIRNSLLIQMQASNQVANLSDEDQDKVAKAFQRPERPFFAQIHKDKIILPTVAAFAIFGAVVPNAVLNPAAISQRYIASQAAERADQKRRNAEVRVAQEALDRKAAEEQASRRAQEEAATAQKTEAETVAAPIQSQSTQEASPVPTSTSNPKTVAVAPVAGTEQPISALLAADPSRQIKTSWEFMVVAPEESKQLLTGMLHQATSAFTVSEFKGKIETFAKPATGDRKAARKLNEQGLAALKSDDFAQALAALKSATAADPADVEILNNYVYALIKARRLQDAESEAGRLLTISPGRSSAWANLAEVYALKNKNEEAVAALVLAFQFSSNKDRTVTFLRERAVDANSPLQAAAKKTIQIIQKM
jgi:tetratricopeptide (TPR) repeat protein